MLANSSIKQTELLDDAKLQQVITAADPQLFYRPVPHSEIDESHNYPVWRVRLILVEDPTRQLGLDINDAVNLGRGSDAPDVIDLTPLGAENQGVSRQHLMLRPTSTNLIAMDVGSTNGTLRNGRSIGIRTPYSLVHGDILTLGTLQILVNIVDRPRLQTGPLQMQGVNFIESFSQIAKAITSQLDLDDVLNQVVSTALSLTNAAEGAIWLVDQNSGELFLEVERGMDSVRAQRQQFPLPNDSLVHKVMRTGQPIRAHKQPKSDQRKLTTGHLVEALAYVPIMLGGIAFGVLTVGHRETVYQFSDQDELLLKAVADYAAIAIQNARLFQATDQELQRRVRELSALNEVSRSVSASLDLEQVYQVLLDEINKYCPVTAVRLYVRDRDPSHLLLFQANEAAGDLPRYPLNRGIVGQVMRESQAVVSNNMAECPTYEPKLDGIAGQVVTSLACIPLQIQNQSVGVLLLLNRLNGEFTQEDLTLLSAFAHPMATAVENARLFAESVRQRKAIEATAQTFTQPLLLLDDVGNLLVSNETANALLEMHMAQLFEAVSSGVGRTREVSIGDKTYLSTIDHLPDVGTIVVMQDITYVKKLEKDRSDFLHMLSHDLKNPLMAVNGWSTLIERTADLDEQANQYVAEIHIAADRMLRMINQLLETVKQEDAVQLVRQPCHLDQIMKQVLNDVRGAALHKSIRLELVTKGAVYPIWGDETRLYHMLLNLVDNAIKYSPNATRVDVQLVYGRQQIGLAVLDEGPGIPEKDLERIFNKYFRSSQTGEQSGSGLGLAAVQGIVTAHGGRVWAENRSERGTVFKVTLPGSLRLTGEKD